ncbi:MAG TPA: hypothetical protein VE377_18625 [Candidatus Dormibacteraeota bacterium]|nr:hypothetical protein [Candidatus Dormibacteraeota bacterium]
MSSRLLQFPPQTSTRAVRMRAIPLRWVGLDGGLGDNGFLSSWLEDDTHTDGTSVRRRINWGAISGLALSLAISATFWAGVALLIARLVK